MFFQQLISYLSDNMCTGKCSFCIAITLYPFVLLSITCNILLFFPDWDIEYVKEGHITQEVKFMGGIVGGGVLALIPAFYIHLTGQRGCCGNRIGMLFSVVFAAVGVAGAMYSFGVALLGLTNGPFCKGKNGTWQTPFANSHHKYLGDDTMWAECVKPKNIVQFNTALFLTLMVASVVQALLCVSQIINGLIGCLCGTCRKEESEFD